MHKGLQCQLKHYKLCQFRIIRNIKIHDCKCLYLCFVFQIFIPYLLVQGVVLWHEMCTTHVIVVLRTSLQIHLSVGVTLFFFSQAIDNSGLAALLTDYNKAGSLGRQYACFLLR